MEEEKKEVKITQEEYAKLKSSKEKTKALVVVLVFTMVIMTILIVIFFCVGNKGEEPKSNDENQQVNNSEKYKNSVFKGEYETYGVVYAKGYAKVEEYEDKYENEKGEKKVDKYNLVSFYVTDTFGVDLEHEISDWFRENENAVKYIDFGCVKDNVITLERVADDWYDPSNTGIDDKNNFDNYWKKVPLNSVDSQKILSSNKENPITVKIEKLKFSLGGGEGSACTSTVSGVEIVE